MQKIDKLLQKNETNYQNQEVSIKRLEPSNTFTYPKEQVQTVTHKSGYNYQRDLCKTTNKKGRSLIVESANEEQSAATKGNKTER